LSPTRTAASPGLTPCVLRNSPTWAAISACIVCASCLPSSRAAGMGGFLRRANRENTKERILFVVILLISTASWPGFLVVVVFLSAKAPSRPCRKSRGHRGMEHHHEQGDSIGHADHSADYRRDCVGCGGLLILRSGNDNSASALLCLLKLRLLSLHLCL